MDATGFYYTLSTIAQTLGGAFGFLVAVVLYRLQVIEREIPALKLLAEQTEQTRRMQMHYPEPTVRERNQLNSDAAYASVERAERGLEAVKKELSRSIKLTGVTIGMCLLFLPFVNAVSKGSAYYFGCPMVFVLVAMSLLCLRMYFRLVASVTKSGA
jgi:hypothetical protein